MNTQNTDFNIEDLSSNHNHRFHNNESITEKVEVQSTQLAYSPQNCSWTPPTE